MKLMKVDLSRHAPAGMELKEEKTVFIVGMTFSVLFGLIHFMVRFAGQREKLYWKRGVNQTVIPGAVMPDFVEILGDGLIGFTVLAALMAAAIVIHYAYHFHESKSIYTMRRLPSVWELHRRCMTLPMCGIAISLVTAFLVLLICYCFYMALTPEECLMPNQWQKIWSGL